MSSELKPRLWFDCEASCPGSLELTSGINLPESLQVNANFPLAVTFLPLVDSVASENIPVNKETFVQTMLLNSKLGSTFRS